MRLLFKHPRAIVFHGRWQDIIPLLKNKVDVTITDPPYTEHVHSNIRSANTTGIVKVRKWEPKFAPLSEYSHVEAFLQNTSRWVLCFCALEQFGDYLVAAPGGQRSGKNPEGTYIRAWVWRKQQAAPQLSGDRPANSCEGVAVMHPTGKMHWNGHGQHAWTDLDRVDNCVQCGRERAEKRHPAQKPTKLISHLVEKFSDEGETVADWFAGSGSLAKAALPLGRKVLLVEEDLTWAEECARVCAELVATPSLNGVVGNRLLLPGA